MPLYKSVLKPKLDKYSRSGDTIVFMKKQKDIENLFFITEIVSGITPVRGRSLEDEEFWFIS